MSSFPLDGIGCGAYIHSSHGLGPDDPYAKNFTNGRHVLAPILTLMTATSTSQSDDPSEQRTLAASPPAGIDRMRSPVPAYVNLSGDYRYLKEGYYKSLDAELKGLRVYPTCQEIIAYLTNRSTRVSENR